MIGRHNSQPHGASNCWPLPTRWAQVHVAHRPQFADVHDANAKKPGVSRAPELLIGQVRPLGCLFLDTLVGSGFFRWLWPAARSLCESSLDLLDRLGLGDPLNRRNLTRQPIERRFVELPL